MSLAGPQPNAGRVEEVTGIDAAFRYHRFFGYRVNAPRSFPLARDVIFCLGALPFLEDIDIPLQITERDIMVRGHGAHWFSALRRVVLQACEHQSAVPFLASARSTVINRVKVTNRSEWFTQPNFSILYKSLCHEQVNLHNLTDISLEINSFVDSLYDGETSILAPFFCLHNMRRIRISPLRMRGPRMPSPVVIFPDDIMKIPSAWPYVEIINVKYCLSSNVMFRHILQLSDTYPNLLELGTQFNASTTPTVDTLTLGLTNIGSSLIERYRLVYSREPGRLYYDLST